MSTILKENQALEHKRFIPAKPGQLEFSWKRMKAFSQSVFSMFTVILSCSTTGIFWKLTNAWFQQLSYQILKANNSYSMFFSHHFQASCLSGKARLFGWMSDTRIFQSAKVSRRIYLCGSTQVHTTRLNRPQHSHLNIDTNHHHFPDFSFFFFNLVSLEQHLSTSLSLLVQAKLSICVTYWIQFVQS